MLALDDELDLEGGHRDEEQDAVVDEDVTESVPVVLVFVEHTLEPEVFGVYLLRVTGLDRFPHVFVDNRVLQHCFFEAHFGLLHHLTFDVFLGSPQLFLGEYPSLDLKLEIVVHNAFDCH